MEASVNGLECRTAREEGTLVCFVEEEGTPILMVQSEGSGVRCACVG